MKTIATDDALRASGHYSQAIAHEGLIYVSGQLPFDFRTGEPIHGSAGSQAAAAITNLERVLVAGGSALDQVLRCTVYLSDIADWDEINAVYAQHFGEHKPARAVVPTGPLHFGFKVEIDAIAIVSSS
ncbi:MAG: Rid family detoxifying hydrolase [Planctomycetota bacterium]